MSTACSTGDRRLQNVRERFPLDEVGHENGAERVVDEEVVHARHVVAPQPTEQDRFSSKARDDFRHCEGMRAENFYRHTRVQHDVLCDHTSAIPPTPTRCSRR